MTNKLHTSVQTQEIFFALGQSLGLQPYILSKLAIALSIRQGKLKKADYETDNNGLELSRQTIFGDHDLIFKTLIMLLLSRRSLKSQLRKSSKMV